MDWERFLKEVMAPLKRGIPFTYRPYDCHAAAFGEPMRVKPGALTLVEGSYSCHPELWEFYHLHVFLTVSPEEQLRRIRNRNGVEGMEIFRKKWITHGGTLFPGAFYSGTL